MHRALIQEPYSCRDSRIDPYILHWQKDHPLENPFVESVVKKFALDFITLLDYPGVPCSEPKNLFFLIR